MGEAGYLAHSSNAFADSLPPHAGFDRAGLVDQVFVRRRYSAIVIRYWQLARIQFPFARNDAATRASVSYWVRTRMQQDLEDGSGLRRVDMHRALPEVVTLTLIPTDQDLFNVNLLASANVAARQDRLAAM